MPQGSAQPDPNPRDEEERLRVEAAQADPNRFSELYEQHFERVYAFVARRVGNTEDAQDLTSEVFHRALAKIGSFEWRGAPFSAWLFRIATNEIADRWRRLARERNAPPLTVAGEPSLEEVEYRARLFRLVDGLPADQQHVIRQRFAAQRTIRDIAQSLGRSEGAVKQLQFRGLQNLRARLDQANA